jgi:arsenite transporter
MSEMSLSGASKLQPFILFAAVLFGFFVGNIYVGFSNYAETILYYVVIALVYAVMLGVPHQKFWKAFKNIKFFGVSWFANFVIIPLLAWVLALIFLKDHPAIFVGFILYLIAPCTDWFLVFTSMARGNVPLGLALLPTNLILQIILIPVFLRLFAGELVPFEFSLFFETFLIFIVLPFILALVTRYILTKARSHEWAHNFIDTIVSPFQTITLVLVLFVMFAGQGTNILNNFGPLTLVFFPIIIFFFASFILSQFISRKFNLGYEEGALLTCTTVARNSPISLAIAIGLFPDRPLIHVAIIIGVLIELPLLIVVVRALRAIRKKYPQKT